MKQVFLFPCLPLTVLSCPWMKDLVTYGISEHTARNIKISVITERGRLYLNLRECNHGESVYLVEDSISEALILNASRQKKEIVYVLQAVLTVDYCLI